MEYHGQGNRGGNDPRCASLVDMDNMDECWYGKFSCKCQDAKNNTYSCLRRMVPAGDEGLAVPENDIYCIFKVIH